MKKREKAEKRPFFTTANFVTAVVCLVVFLVIALGGFYLSAGEFVSAKLAAIYAALSLVGALAILFRMYRFVGLYYVGCAIGWAVGWYVGGLKGDFAPTAGTICTVFFIAAFSVFGVLAQWKGLRKAMARRKEEKAAAALQAEEEARQAEEDRKHQELDRARLDRENAAARMNDAFGVEDGVDVTTPAAALDQAARLAFAEEQPMELEIPPEREAVAAQSAQEPAVPAMEPQSAPDESEKTAAASVEAAAAAEDKPQI